MMVYRFMRFSFVASGLSDIGCVRENNEDVWGEIEECRFFVLADGMGGHRGGEIASREAVSHLLFLIRKAFKGEKNLSDSISVIKNAIIEVNQVVHRLGRADPALRGMGTTLSCLMLHEKGIIMGHVGDSRIYRLRQDKLIQLTKDHSLLTELVDLGQISEKFHMDFAYKNIITKAIGTEFQVDPAVASLDVEVEDMFLLCTDGLTDMLSIREIAEILQKKAPVDEIVKNLIETSKAKGGYDNITAILVKIQGHETDLSR